jgi:protein-S-isoprenylcysteine O-methyltransferase Ste14
VRSVGYLAKLFTRWVSVTLSVSLLLFLVAGRTQLSSLRYYLVAFCALLLATMFSVDPGLAQERSRPVEKATTPGRLAAGLWFLATLVFAALDIGRLHRSDSVSGDVRMGSLLLFGAGTMLQLWAMVINPFFSPEIRLQSERGHQLVRCGPYRFLRHPGYLADHFGPC